MIVRKNFRISALVLLTAAATQALAYEEDTHFQVTYVLCRAAGFSPAEAMTVAAVDQGMDDSPGTVANSGFLGANPHVPEEWKWHALDLNGNMGPGGVLKRKEELFRIALTRKTASQKLFYLGVFFHYQQDTWAHRHHYDGNPHSYDKFTTYNTPLGHAKDLHQPDRPPFDPVAAYMNLEDGVRYAKRFIIEGLGRQPNAFIANYTSKGGSQEDGWPENGKYYHQLAPAGVPNKPRRFLTNLIRAQINAYSSSIDPSYFGYYTADEVSYDKVRTALQNVCTNWASRIGYQINIPSRRDKQLQGYSNLTTKQIEAGMG